MEGNLCDSTDTYTQVSVDLFYLHEYSLICSKVEEQNDSSLKGLSHAGSSHIPDPHSLNASSTFQTL